jgi:hypothetical protein
MLACHFIIEVHGVEIAALFVVVTNALGAHRELVALDQQP